MFENLCTYDNCTMLGYNNYLYTSRIYNKIIWGDSLRHSIITIVLLDFHVQTFLDIWSISSIQKAVAVINRILMHLFCEPIKKLERSKVKLAFYG